MQNSDKPKFLMMLSQVADYYRQTIPEGVMNIYWEGLKQYDLAAIEKAFWAHTQQPDNGQFMPKIADVTRFFSGRTTDQAAVAWSKVDKAMRSVGTYNDVVFDDSIIHRVILDMGGWIHIGTKTDKDWAFLQNEFQTRYRGYKISSDAPDYPARLVGIANAQNEIQGFELKPPVLIGEQTKAKLVLEGGSKKALIQMQRAGDQVKNLALS
jgi:hypothetical protein